MSKSKALLWLRRFAPINRIGWAAWIFIAFSAWHAFKGEMSMAWELLQVALLFEILSQLHDGVAM